MKNLKEQIKNAPPVDRKAFQVNKNGVYYYPGDGDDPIWICSRLDVAASVRDLAGASWGKLLEFKDPESNLHRWAMPMEMLKGSGDEYRGILLSLGLQIAPGKKTRDHLANYIQTERPAQLGRCVATTGWHDKSFVLPNETIGPDDAELIVFQSDSHNVLELLRRGDPSEWRGNVAALCSGNSRLVFAISTAFASPLLEGMHEEGGGFHFRGSSSVGKTTALIAATSVYGGKDYMGSWRATDNGLEGEASRRNDLLMVLDEISQVDSTKAGEIAYLLANGKGKLRANRQGGARPVASWKLLYLSSGECSLATQLNNAGRRSTAGQEVRVVDIPADAGKTLGIFDCLPAGFKDGDQLARALKENASRYHGTAGFEFISRLANDLDNSLAKVRDTRDAFIKTWMPPQASGQVSRVTGRFALVAAAGELATEFGITGWEPGEAISAAKICLDAWLQARGTEKSLEPKFLLTQVRQFFEAHGEARFTPLNAVDEASSSSARPTINRAGFRQSSGEDITYFVLPEVFKSEICKGWDPSWAARVLAENGLLERDSEGNFTKHKRLSELGKKRVYWLTSKVLED